MLRCMLTSEATLSGSKEGLEGCKCQAVEFSFPPELWLVSQMVVLVFCILPQEESAEIH